MEINLKEFFSAVAIALTFIAFYPYIRSIVQGKTKPHVFSWIIWGSTTFVIFLAQVEGNAGVGAWPIGISACITIFVAILAYFKRSDITITQWDWLFFISALSALPFWYFTSDPMWAVVILTIIEVFGFAPTIRKTYKLPHSESLVFLGLFTARNLIVVLALETYSITTVLFPAVIAVVCMGLITMIIIRRKVLATNSI